ncbi:hypothetical protein POM88_004682 [Heracleum sosnowskyi]|uniref:Uncharacterized protein n=1 Tax=Heracleum sosnowskyi TaxID=360622 RepID=A0AAD8NDN0_9APIA|nr:hypothetical protein POM88_004682 [Heracleum sosnowskyi]
MARLTQEQLINEVMHLHSLHRQGPPTPNPNPYPISNPNPPFPNPHFIPNSPIFNPIHPITHPTHHFPNPNHIPHPPIFNSIPNLVYPISNHNRNPIFNPGPSSVYPNNNPVIPILGPDRISNPHILNYNHGCNVPTIPRYDSHCYMGMRLSNEPEPVSSVRSYVPRNVEGVSHSNLNKKLSRLSLAVPKLKKKKNKKNKGKKGVGSNEEAKKWPPISENEWPCNPVSEPTVGWPELKLNPVVERVLTEEENARLVASKSQQKALDAAKEMFRENMDSDGEVDDYVSSDDDNDDDEDECEEYKFFLKIFTEDSELRCYYEKNCESGEFSCLVCLGIGQKVGKKFKDCVALVQHSIAIAKTKKRQAHRALGKVICNVLGWDIQKLPSINLPKISDSEDNGPHDPKEVVQEKNDSVSEVLPDTAVSLTTDVGSELMVCEDSLMASDGNNSVDTFLNDISSTPKK